MDGRDSSDWPPPGYTEDVKVSNGRKIKYYTNVETGKKFYSKKEVTRYMNTKDTCHDVTQAVNNQDKSCSENNVSQMNNQDKSCSENNVSQMNNQDKSCSENNVSQIVEGTKDSHEWLPPGWTVELKPRKSGTHAGTTYKVYVDPSTGNKFYSKPEVTRYLKSIKQNNIAGEGQIHGNGEVSSSNQKASEDSENMRVQSRVSKRRKSDIDQPTHGIEEGSFSKQQASQESEEVGEESCISKRKKSGIKRPSTKISPSHGAGDDFPLNEKTSLGSKENGAHSPLSKRKKPGSDSPSAKSVSSAAVKCDSVDELPPGWKKEVITRQNGRGTRKDAIYIDPVHGHKFRSKKEVFRYLQNGDASRSARRPAKGNEASPKKDNSPTTDDASLKKSGCFVTGRPLFPTDDDESKGAKSFGTCSPAQQVESSKKQLDCSVSDPNTIITSILAELNENHSVENLIEDAEIETVSVDVKQPPAVSTQSDLPEKQVPEIEQEKQSDKAATQQSSKSRNRESLNLGRRASKRLAGQNPEAAANLDLDEHALPAVVDKSASPSLSLNVCGQELLQHSDPPTGTGKSDQASLSGKASLDDLPPGWKKEFKITKKASGIRKDPLYIDPVHGYAFYSKKDVFRYLETGDIKSCAIRPVKRDLHATTKESSPATPNTNSKKLECSDTKGQSFGAKESKGRKRSVTCSPEVQAESSKKQSESGVSNANTIITSSAADINAKHSNENVIETAEKSLDTKPEIRDSSADTKVIAAESVAVSAVPTPLSDLPPEKQLPENVHEKHSNKDELEQSRRSKTKKPLTPGRRISKRLVGHSPEPVADLDLGERAFRAVVKKSASSGLPLNVSGQELPQQTDLATGSSDQPPASNKASSRDDPLEVVKGLSEGQAFKEQRVANELTSEKQDDEKILQDSQPAGISHESGKVHLEHQLVKERPTGELAKEEKDSQKRLFNDSQPAELESESRVLPAEDRSVSERSTKKRTGYSDQASLSRKASGDELSPGLEKEILNLNKDPTVGPGNSDHASLSRQASGDELPPGSGKEILSQKKDLTLATSNSDQAYLSREGSLDETPPGRGKEILRQNEYPIVGTGNSDHASLSRKFSLDEIPPGWENVIPAQNKDSIVGTGNSNQASLSRKFSLDEIPPGWENEIFAYNKDPTIGTGNSNQASLRIEASADELPPGWEKEMLTQNKDPTVGTGNSGSLDDIPPGWEKEILARNKNPSVETCNSDRSLLRREASVDELPPGWKTEFRMRNTTRGIKKDPFYTDPVHGYVFRSKKDVMRYLQTGDIRSCAMRPTKRDPDSTMKDDSPSTHDTGSKKLGCSLTGIQLSATEESKGRKCSVTCSLELQAESSNEHPESSVFNPNNSTSSIVADITEIRDSKAIAAESVDVRRSLAVSSQSNSPPEQQLPEYEKEKHSNKGVPAGSRKFRNSKSSTPVRRVSKKLSRHNPEMVADLDLGERSLRAVVNNSASSVLPLNVSGRELPQQTDLATGVSDQPSLSKNASSRDDPVEVVKCLSEGQTFKVANGLTSQKQNDVRILQDSQLAGISHESGMVHLEHQVVKEEQDSRKRLLNNSQPAELASISRVFPVEDLSVSERSAIEQVSEKRDYENKQWQYSQLAEPSWRSVVDLNVENKQWQDSQLLAEPSWRSNVDLNVENKQWQDSQLLAEPSWRSTVDLNVENQQWQDTQLAEPSHRIVDLNVENQQWQDPQLAEPSQRRVDLNVENQPVREKQTGGQLVTENQDEQNRRLHAQLASYPFADYWSDPCMEFAFKTLTGALPVEDTLPFQGSAHHEYNTNFTQVDDGCFELPLFNTSSFYMNDVPNNCAPLEQHVVKEQPPINQTFFAPPINQTFLPAGNNSIPGCSSVVSQNADFDTQAKDYNNKQQHTQYHPTSGVWGTQAKDYHSKFKSQR
ncbi:uncharacterized protein LOC132634936 isoform X1 [Lycium barbarum]|uniref:uncharacterized protein LOC132634936 isoform X1 n=1 Tax=Lycium barbarum TaxID=112863 RepID=UPI00293E61E8|nr:uncharacterized protein LOC132634936 isoform X1 [Lycium barbarum]